MKTELLDWIKLAVNKSFKRELSLKCALNLLECNSIRRRRNNTTDKENIPEELKTEQKSNKNSEALEVGHSYAAPFNNKRYSINNLKDKYRRK